MSYTMTKHGQKYLESGKFMKPGFFCGKTILQIDDKVHRTKALFLFVARDK